MAGTDSSAHRITSFSPADAMTLLRIPLAIAFPMFPDPSIRLVVLLLAGISDLGDGWLARRFGSSRIGAVLDPIADKLFVAVAFAVVWGVGALTWYEVVAVLARDIVATIAFVSTVATGRATAVPARVGGKVVTVLQMLTLIVFVLNWPHLQSLAWMTGGIALYAIYDYNQPFFRKLRTR